MKHLDRLRAGVIAAWIGPALLPSVAAAQDYPTRTIRIISPVPAGGLSDIAMRPMAIELSKRLGQPVVIENRAGANGMLAGRACAQAAPDGYTICNLFNDTVLNAPFLFKTVGYERKDFATITNGYFITSGFLVAPSVKANTLPELIALSKSTPGGLNLGVPATTTEMFIRSFNMETGSNFQIIPYKSGNEVANALLDQLGASGLQRRRHSRAADPGRQVQGDRASIRTTAGRAAGCPDSEGVQARAHPHQALVRLHGARRHPARDHQEAA